MELLEIISSKSLFWNLPLWPLSLLRYALWWNGTVFLNRAIFIFVGWVIRYGWLVYRAVIWGPATTSQNEKDTWAITGKRIKRACLCLGRLLIRKRQWRTTVVRLKNGREQALIALLLLWQVVHSHSHPHPHPHSHTAYVFLITRWHVLIPSRGLFPLLCSARCLCTDINDQRERPKASSQVLHMALYHVGLHSKESCETYSVQSKHILGTHTLLLGMIL